jgi:two-component system, NarL family, sensor histidine kinase DesK
VQDDGGGGLRLEGYGIRGMRERIEAFGGSLERQVGDGTRLIVMMPLENAGTAP